MHDITLRQIEVMRAVMLRGTINGAADHLGVSAPGISRLVRHTEESLALRLFERRGGLFTPAIEAGGVFDQIRVVCEAVENLQRALDALQSGQDGRLAFATAPSVAGFITARAIGAVRRSTPDLSIDVETLRIEETLDYLLPERGEFVITSALIDNPSVVSSPMREGRLVAILPADHPLASRAEICVYDLAHGPLIGLHPTGPYAAMMATPLRDAGIAPQYGIRARDVHTVVRLVQNGLGAALIDEFAMEGAAMPGLVRRPLVQVAPITIYLVTKAGHQMSQFADHAIEQFRSELSMVS